MNLDPATTDLYRAYGNPQVLADLLKGSAGYLQLCADKHNATGPKLRFYTDAVRRCERISGEMERLKDNNLALIRYRNALYDLDAPQIEAFARIIIDYQARIGSEFVPVSTNHYLADLTAIIFALAAIENPACLIGVGTGFAPRHRQREAA